MRELVVLLLVLTVVAQTLDGCFDICSGMLFSTPRRIRLTYDRNGGMTADKCNNLAIGFDKFYITNKECFGALEGLDDWDSTLTGSSACLLHKCANASVIGVAGSYVAAFTKQISDPLTILSTGLFGVSLLNAISPVVSFTNDHNYTVGVLRLNFSTYLTSLDVGWDIEKRDLGPFNESVVMDPKEYISEIYLHTTDNDSLNLTINYTKIDGLHIYTNFNRSFHWGLDINTNNTVDAFPALNYALVGITSRTSDVVEQLGFSWLASDLVALFPPSSSQKVGGARPCLSNGTEMEFDPAHAREAEGVYEGSQQCKEILKALLTSKQEGFSYIVVALLVAAIFFDISLLIVSKIFWQDKTADYITVIAASLGMVEWVSEALMLRSLSFNEEFIVEYLICLAAFIASSVINIIGNPIILWHENFKPWLSSNPIHRYLLASCLFFCFFKGNIVAILASRLNYRQSKVCQLPWSRTVQLRFRILSLFVLFFGSIPQVVMMSILHEKLSEWTPLTMLFMALSLCSMVIIIWRAVFEFVCKEHGIDKDRNLSEWDLASQKQESM